MWKKAAATVLIGASIGVGAAGVATAREVTHVGGGTWWHGLTAATVYSNYLHGTRCHGSTAIGTTTDRDTVGPGYVSRAMAPRATSNNETYWRHC